MRKSFVVLMTTGLVLTAGSGVALAVQENSAGVFTTSSYTSKGNVVSNQYKLDSGTAGTWGDGYDSFTFSTNGKKWNYRENGVDSTTVVYLPYGGLTSVTSTHPYGTWNSPYTFGVDGYNYNDSQDYTDDGADVVQRDSNGDTLTVAYSVPSAFGGEATGTLPAIRFTSGPHGGYLTSTHRCRECHAVHRAAGKFKLLRSDTRFEACDWCHGTGAGSGFNIQMDNDDANTTEYNVGHTMGFGIQSGKWKAPDDTYPAYTPNYWMGGFSCFDCHSPHANPARIMGFDQDGAPIPSIVNTYTGEVFVIGNPGHDMVTLGGKGFAGWNHAELKAGHITVPAFGGLRLPKPKPYYLAGSWLLIKNPDREMDTYYSTDTPMTVNIKTFYGYSTPGSATSDPVWTDQADVTVTPGGEIPDTVDMALLEFDSDTAYPVNKVPTDWNNPIGSASLVAEDFGDDYDAAFDAMGAPYNLMDLPPNNLNYGYNVRNPFCRSLILDEFCTDCHDGNAGFHTTQAPLFSEDRALRNQTMSGSSTDTTSVTDNAKFKGSYDLAYGHDANVRH